MVAIGIPPDDMEISARFEIFCDILLRVESQPNP
jgi:hypothetical protein